MSIVAVISSFISRPDLADALTVDSFLLFFRLVVHLKDHLSWHRAPTFPGPPLHLPSEVTDFLSSALSLHSPDVVGACWSILRNLAWDHAPPSGSGGDLLDLFIQHGVPLGIGFYNLYPPTRTCLDPRCVHIRQGRPPDPQDLSHIIAIRVTYFSKEFGPVPAVSYSANCRKCYARYYPTYYIHEHRNSRVHYPGVPPAIHVATHAYLETSLCNHFTWSMVFAWVSATNNGRIYDLEHAHSSSRFPPEWSIATTLTPVLVWDAFFLYALLREYDERGYPLVLENKGDQAERLNPVLQERNQAMVGPGREHWSHVCDRCCATKEDDGQLSFIRAVVMDGVTVGRPCCQVRDCQGDLPSQRARFCNDHSDMDGLCAVDGCDISATPGFRTCTEPSHRKLEDVAGHSALFQLQRRLQRLKLVRVENEGENTTEELLQVDEDGEVGEDGGSGCPTKPDSGNSKPRARFGRRRTHNEQLCVATCGVMLARATFFGSEAINGARMFLHAVFPTPASLPRCIFYDNACSLLKHLQSVHDDYFGKCALPVDVFHMKTKHKESDDFCGQYCNPAMFPDLVENGHWRFNSSAAEMTNAWFGGYQAIVREMRKERFDFFLDEMIKLRNRAIIKDLEESGAHPYDVPLHYFGL